MTPVSMALLCGYLLAFGMLLWAAKKHRRLYALAKGVTSVLFLVVGWWAWLTGGRQDNGQFALLFIGMVLCAGGDVFLGVANSVATHVNRKPFLVGALCFTLAHGVFCLLFYARAGAGWADVLLPAVMVVSLFCLERADKVRLKRMRPVAYVYTVLVSLMCTKAVAPLAAPVSVDGMLLAAGAVLFLLSDVVLLFLYFATRRAKWLRPVNLATYYAGMLLMAWAARWM